MTRIHGLAVLLDKLGLGLTARAVLDGTITTSEKAAILHYLADTIEQERADTIAFLEGIVRGCERYAAERPDQAAMHDNTKRVLLTAIGDINGGIHEGEAG
jgi:hypothetical protein